MRVIVIGSGIAGLSAAIAIRRVGMNATIYERTPELHEVGAGISLWANALRALDYLGAGDAVRAVSQPLVRSELRVQQGRSLLCGLDAKPLEQQVGVSPLVAMVHRADLVAVLSGFLPDGVAKYGHECVGIRQKGDRVEVAFANGHVDEAEVLVGADGIRSVVRTTLFGAEEPRYAGYTCWRGVAPRPKAMEPGYFGEWWGRGQRFGITTLPEHRVYWFAVQNAATHTKYSNNKTILLDLFRHWPDPVQELIASTPEAKILHNDIIDRPPIRRWSRGRIGLIGDAAHPTTPNLGQGGCMAIEDAVVLARCLQHAAEPEKSWQAFTETRERRARQVVQESWRLGRVAQWEGRVSSWVRDQGMWLLLKLFGSAGMLQHARFDVGPLRAS